MVQRMRLGMPDASGRQSVEPSGERFTVEADLVIKALGFDPEPLPTLWNTPGLEVSRWGTLAVDHKTQMTTLPGVFGAGDIVRGASLVVWAIKDGRDAAARMHDVHAAERDGGCGGVGEQAERAHVGRDGSREIRPLLSRGRPAGRSHRSRSDEWADVLVSRHGTRTRLAGAPNA